MRHLLICSGKFIALQIFSSKKSLKIIKFRLKNMEKLKKISIINQWSQNKSKNNLKVIKKYFCKQKITLTKTLQHHSDEVRFPNEHIPLQEKMILNRTQLILKFYSIKTFPLWHSILILQSMREYNSELREKTVLIWHINKT